MSPSMLFLLAVYAIAIMVASISGGWLTRRLRLSHVQFQLLISLVGGLMIGIAVFHMIPHALHGTGSGGINQICWALVLGILCMFFLVRFFHFHHHAVDDRLLTENDENGSTSLPVIDSPANHAHDHPHHHHGHACDHHPIATRSLSWIGMLFGLGVHTILDGVALASTVQVEAAHGHESFGLAGIGVFFVILLHKPIDAMSLISLMRAQGATSQQTLWMNLGFSLFVPIGIGLILLFGNVATPSGSSFASLALAFSGGVFLCIALSDLLPEMEFHSHHRGPLSLALVLGVILAWAIGFLEPAGSHDVDVHPQDEHHHDGHAHDHKH